MDFDYGMPAIGRSIVHSRTSGFLSERHTFSGTVEGNSIVSAPSAMRKSLQGLRIRTIGS